MSTPSLAALYEVLCLPIVFIEADICMHGPMLYIPTLPCACWTFFYGTRVSVNSMLDLFWSGGPCCSSTSQYGCNECQTSALKTEIMLHVEYHVISTF